jgi:hypothetical protein
MSNELPIVVKQVLRLYDMEVDTFIMPSEVGSRQKFIRIKTTITFTPKEFNNISPERVEAYGVLDYRKDSELFLDMVYLRDNDMPILPYIDDTYNLDEFLEKIVKTESKKKFESVRHKL